MDEKILIKAKLKKNYVALILFWLAAATTIMLPIVAFIVYKTKTINYWGKIRSYDDIYDSFIEFFPESFFYFEGVGKLMIGVIVVLALIALRYYFRFKCDLVVTDKRIYGISAHTTILGKTSFAKRIDLPIDQIVSIGLGAFSSIEVVTASADRIKFYLLENRNEVYQTISNAISNIIDIIEDIIETNDEENSSVVSSADELKKYKELLDMGIITQEEFDAKKKQLLGL